MPAMISYEYASSSSYLYGPKETIYVYKHVPQNATSCLVNIVYGGTNSTPTSVLAASDGSFKVNRNGAFIPVESPLCTPFTNDNVQTITVVPANTNLDRTTKTFWESAPVSSSGAYSGSPRDWYYPQPLLSTPDIVAIVMCSVATLGILCGVGFWFWRRRRARKASPAVSFPMKTFEDDLAGRDSRSVGKTQSYASYSSEVPQVVVDGPSNRSFDKDAESAKFTEMASSNGDARSSMTWIGSGSFSPRGKRDSMARYDPAVSPM